jgi:hypothetical protein
MQINRRSQSPSTRKMDASTSSALRTALSHSRDGVIAELQARVAELQDEIASSSEREWARLVRVHFHHVTSEFLGRQSDANAPRRFAERMSFQFVEIIAHARWGLAEPIVIHGRPHAAGRFNFREHDALSIEEIIRRELIRTLHHETLIECQMWQFMRRIEIVAGIPGRIHCLPPGVGLRSL